MKLLALWTFQTVPHNLGILPLLHHPGQGDRMGTRGIEKLKWALRPTQVLWKLSDRSRQLAQSRTLDPTAAVGKRGEDIAHRYLQRSGFKVIARNFKPGPDSEIDIVARLGDRLIFVEVKTLSSSEHSAPERAVDKTKEQHILRAARAFATRANVDYGAVRFDIVSVVLSDPPTITHFEDAFYG